MEKNLKEAMDLKQKRIDKAISSRERSIAYFNSLNSAISLVSAMPIENDAITKERINIWANYFYERWQSFYMETAEPETEERAF